MAGKRANGDRELNYTARLNIDEIKRNTAIALQSFKQLSEFKIAPINTRVTGIDTKPLTAFQQARINANKTIIDAQLESERLRQKNLELSASLKEGRITAQENAAAIKANNQARIELARSTKEARLAQVAANGSYDEANRRLIALGRSIKAAEGGFNSTNPAIRSQVAEYRELNRSLQNFDSQMLNNQRRVGNYAGALGGLTGALSGMAAGFLSASVLLQNSFNTALKTDAIKTSLEFTFKSIDVAKQKMDGLRETADRLGLEYVSLADAYRSFAGAAVASNFPLKETDRIFNAVANAGAKLKLSSDQVTGALTALQQMISKGTVQSEELRGQLGERLPGAFAIAARAMGVTQQELGKLLKDGKVLASELLPKLADELDNTFSNDKNEKVKSMQGSVNALKNSFSELVETKGAVSGFFEFVLDRAGGLTRAITKMSQALGIFYDLATDPKKLIGDSIKSGNDFGLSEIRENAAQAAAAQIKNQVGKKEAFELLQREAKLIIDLDARYKELKKTQDAIRPGDRNLVDGRNLAEAQKNLQFQKIFVADLNKEYDRLYRGKSKISEVADADLKSIKAIQARINELKKLDGSAIIGNAIFNRIEALKERLKKPIEVKVDSSNAIASAIKSRNDLQSKIDESTKKGVDKQLDADAQELESVKTKYRLLREEAIAYNKEQERIDAERAKKGLKVMGLRVDSGGIVKAETNETEAIRAKQAVVDLQKTLDDQKKLYEDYEFYKEKLGKDAADKKYATLLNADKNYLQELKRQEAEILDPQKSKGSGGAKELSIIDEAKLKTLQDRIAIQQDLVDRANAELLASLMDYEKQAKALEVKFNEDKANILQAGNTKEVEILESNYKKQLLALGDAHAHELSAFQDLYTGIDRLSDKNALKVVSKAEDALKSLKTKGIVISKELESELTLLLANSKQAIEDRLPASLIDLANEIDRVASSVSGVNKEFANIISTVANVIGQVGNVKKSLDDLEIAGKSGDIIGQLTAGLGVLGGAVSIVTSVVGLVTSAIDLFNTRDRKLTSQIKEHQQTLEGLDKSFKSIERGLSNSVGEQVFAGQVKQIEILQAEYQALSDMIDAERAKRKADQSKIEEYIRQLEEIPDRIEAIKRAIDESLLQTNFKKISEDIAQSLTDSFGKGADAADNFDKVLDRVVINAVQNSLKLKFLEPVISRFTEDLADWSKTNDGNLSGFNFDSWKFIIGQAADNVNAGLAEVAKFFPELESEISNGWKSISENIITDLTTVAVIDGVKKIGNSITETISNAILEGFQAQMINEGLREFYAKIEEFQKGGATITKEQVEGLKAEYAVFLTTYNDKLTALEQATGLSFRKLTETTTEAVADGLSILGEGISRVLDSGEINAKAFADNFEDFIKNAVLEGLKSDIFADGLKGLNDKIKEFQKDGLPLTREQIAELRSDYGAFTDDILERLSVISEATGIAFDKVIEEQAAALDSGFESLKDSVIGVFASLDGQTIDAGKKFEEVMKQAVLNSFKTQFLAGALKGFYDQLNSFTKDGATLTSAQISSLRAQYDAMVALGMERMREFEQVSGLSFSAPPEQAAADPLESSLAKGIKQITSEQASALEGITRGQYGLQKRMVELLTIQNGLLTGGGGKTSGDMFNSARDNFNTALQIERNTFNTVVELKHVVAKLDAIQKSGGSMRGDGLA